MVDKYYKYRPILDLLGKSEGTDKGRGYNETLGYGAYTGGHKDLVSMTLAQIDALQTKMLPNKLNSTAIGRYQIIRTTLRTIKKTLKLGNNELFNEEMQDRLACFLLGQRGIDKWLGGSLKEDTLISNLAHEWASLPMPDGNSAYGTVKKGDKHVKQKASVSVAAVRSALAEVKRRHFEEQPKEVIEIAKPVVPVAVDKEVKKKFSLAGWLGTIFSSGGIGALGLAGFGWRELLVIGAVAVVVLLGGLALRGWIVNAIKDIRAELGDD